MLCPVIKLKKMYAIAFAAAVILAVVLLSSAAHAQENGDSENSTVTQYSNKLQKNQLYFDVQVDNMGVPNFIVEKWKSEDMGKTWLSIGRSSKYEFRKEINDNGENVIYCRYKHSFDALSEGVYYFRTKVINAPSISSNDTYILVVDTTAPEVSIVSPAPGNQFIVNNPCHIEWKVEEKNIDRGVTIQYSGDGGKTWEDIQGNLPVLGSYDWFPKERHVSHNGLLRVKATDLAGNVAEKSMPGAIIVSKSGLSATRFYRNNYNFKIENFKIRYFKNFDRIELYERIAGNKEWIEQPVFSMAVKTTQDENSFVSTNTFNLDVTRGKDNIYEYKIVPIGDDIPLEEVNSKSPVNPELTFSVVVDTKPPVIKLLRPQPETMIHADKCIIEWEATDDLAEFDNNAVTLEYSEDGEKWILIDGSHPSKGSYSWSLPALKVETKYWLRASATDRAGNVGMAVIEKPVTASEQRMKPVDIIGDVKRINSLKVIIPIVEALNVGESQIKNIELYYRIVATSWNDTKTGPWERYGVFDGNAKSIQFIAPKEALYDFYFRAVSGAGKSYPIPDELTEPDRRILLARAEPKTEIIFPVQFKDEKGFYIAGDMPIKIRYVVSDPFLKPNSVTVFYVYDDKNGRQKKIVPNGENIANSGEVFWTPDPVNIKSCRLQVKAIDIVNSNIEASSKPFDIDNERPRVLPGEIAPIKEKDPVVPVKSGKAKGDFIQAIMTARRLLDTEKDYRHAIASFKTAESILGDADMKNADEHRQSIYFCIGTAYYMLGERNGNPKDFEHSLEYFNKALEKDNGDIYSRWGIARVYYAMGKYDKALPFIKEVYADRDKFTYTSGIMLARSYQKIGKIDEAAKQWQALLDDNRFLLTDDEKNEAESSLKECEKLLRKSGRSATSKKGVKSQK